MKKEMALVKVEATRLIHVVKRQLWTSSLLVAEEFRKRHDDVLKAYRNLECSEEFRLRNFAESSYLNEQGKTQPMYEMTFEGFSFLAMGFTGKRAAEFKEKYITCFSLMAEELYRVKKLKEDPSWKLQRHASSSSFKVMNDILKLVRAEIGKATVKHHYSNEARLINWALTGEFKAIDRDKLPIHELDILTQLEERNTVLIGRGLGYDDRKKILEQYAIDLRPAPLALAQ